MNRELKIIEPHEEWLELCAAAVAGGLTSAEQELLRAHLGHCSICRQALSEYRSMGRDGMPLIADRFAPSDDEIATPSGWNQNESKQRLFDQLASPVSSKSSSAFGANLPQRHGAAGWWLASAATITLCVGFGSYALGRRSVSQAPAPPSPEAAQVVALSHEKDGLERRLTQENSVLGDLEQKSIAREDEISRLKGQLRISSDETRQATAAKASSDQKLQTTTIDRDSLVQKLASAQQAYQEVTTQLTDLRAQRQKDLLNYASVETEASELQSRLRETQARVNDDNQYLASDRDIRELMGARQLYIADVIDVDQNGARRKPFGRVFYTKGKSLVFYAFDLDQQAGVREASTFQAWAREGSDKAHPVSLGIFYVDNAANRRWALKASDPKLLAEINSVFVTVEPKGGSQAPTGRPLLYAYLKTEAPNHP